MIFSLLEKRGEEVEEHNNLWSDCCADRFDASKFVLSTERNHLKTNSIEVLAVESSGL